MIDYFTNEISTYDENAYRGGLLETRAFGGVNTRLSVPDAVPERGRRLRTFFDPDRSGREADPAPDHGDAED